MQFSWGPENFQNKKQPTSDTSEHPHSVHDHTYTSYKSHTDNDIGEFFNDVNHSEIYDAEGNLSKSHIRQLVHVLDTFRISHEAYHEVRMVSKGHLPPIN